MSHANVVLVHGAWADGSSWAKVIGPVEDAARKVVAVPLPLTSLAGDVTALDRVLETQHFTAEPMGARTRARPIDHTPLVSVPAEAVDTILDAAREVTTTT